MKSDSSPTSEEVEIKLAAGSRRATATRLKRLGFRVERPRRFEQNILFDFGDRRLAKSVSLLRLRMEDGRCLLTFKGPPDPSSRYKVRPEIEVEMEPEAAEPLRAILAAAGMREIFRYEKFRTTYAMASRARRKEGLVFFDETPIGNFLELEGAARWIRRTARSLGKLPDAYITASYGQLFSDARRRQGRRAANMVFRKQEKSGRKT